jgi:hypothetical protein
MSVPSSVIDSNQNQLKKKVAALDAVQQVYGYEEVNADWLACCIYHTVRLWTANSLATPKTAVSMPYQLLISLPDRQDFVAEAARQPSGICRRSRRISY